MRPIIFFLGIGLLWSCEFDVAKEVDDQSMDPVDSSNHIASPASLDYTIHVDHGFDYITEDATPSSLKRIFGENQVMVGDIYLGEGIKGRGAVILPGTADSVEIYLGEPGMEEPRFARVRSPQGKWKTPEGIRVGSTLQELRIANDANFHFTGFEWDYGGTVTDWDGGHYAGTNLMVRLDYKGEEPLDSKFIGDQIIDADSLGTTADNIFIREISIRFR